jgi:hypothetical protein
MEVPAAGWHRAVNIPTAGCTALPAFSPILDRGEMEFHP